MSSNQKQQELVKRLEEIRKQRGASAEATETRSETKRRQPTQKRNEETQQRRRRGSEQRRTTAEQRRKPSSTTQPVEQTREPFDTSYKSMENPYQRPTRPRPVKKEMKRIKDTKKSSETFIDQLSDGNKLAQAIVLSEVLSKPIALRKRNR